MCDAVVSQLSKVLGAADVTNEHSVTAEMGLGADIIDGSSGIAIAVVLLAACSTVHVLL